MTVTDAGLIASYRRLSSSSRAIVLIVVAVLLANGPFVSGLLNDSALWWTSGGLAHPLCHVQCVRPMIDPNVGFITQSLGHRAAIDLLHGHVPWWNYFEGLGQPLVGEMQSAALFPLTLLFAMPSGLLWFHVSLEIVAGVSTYYLARRLIVPELFALVGGVLFALNGTYAWLGNAVLNPVAFLPMLLLGVEMILNSAESPARRGWYVTAVALALSLYAGFPEVAYLDGIFCVAWALTRVFSVPRERRPRALRRLGLGAVMGVVLALPVLVPFDDFLKVAFVGGHAVASEGGGLSIRSLPMFFDPYVYGMIFSNKNALPEWGAAGGYLLAGVSVLALVGLVGQRMRPLRMFLGIWLTVAFAGAFNFAHFRTVWNLIPLVAHTSFARYAMPSCEMAVIILAVLGLVDLVTSTRARCLFTFSGVVMILVLWWCVHEASAINNGVTMTTKTRVVLDVLDALPFVSVGLLLILGRFTRARVTPLLIALVVMVESLLVFLAPDIGSPKVLTVDYAPIDFLLRHQGQERFVDFDVIYPNWSSEFGLNSLSAIDLPFPAAYNNLIQRSLYPGLYPENQFVIKNGLVGIEAMESEVTTHFRAYENASVKYLVFPASVSVSAALVKLGVTRVFSDHVAAIYQMPNPRSFFSTSTPSCTVKSTDANEATVHCSSSGATLLRTELSMAGWTATVNGQPATIATVNGVYQRVALPEGTSTVRFRFTPPYERYAILGALLGGFFLIGSLINERKPFLKLRDHENHAARDGPIDART